MYVFDVEIFMNLCKCSLFTYSNVVVPPPPPSGMAIGVVCSRGLRMILR